MSANVTIQIAVWDSHNHSWHRGFTAEATYQAKCGNNLHQFMPGAKICACGASAREKT